MLPSHGTARHGCGDDAAAPLASLPVATLRRLVAGRGSSGGGSKPAGARSTFRAACSSEIAIATDAAAGVENRPEAAAEQPRIAADRRAGGRPDFRQTTLPGLSSPFGSIAAFSVRISAISSGERACASQRCLSVPMPCSAETVPPYSRTSP